MRSGRDPPQMLMGVPPGDPLVVGVRHDLDMAALTGQRHRAAAGRGHQSRDAQPGARPQQRARRRGHRCAGAHQREVFGGQEGQPQRQRGEVVDGHQRVEVERAARGIDRERPVVVGQLDVVARDRIGQPDGRMARARQVVQAVQVLLHGAFERRKIRHLERGDRANPHRRRLQRHPHVGAAYVGQQAGIRGGLRIRRRHRDPLSRIERSGAEHIHAMAVARQHQAHRQRRRGRLGARGPAPPPSSRP